MLYYLLSTMSTLTRAVLLATAMLTLLQQWNARACFRTEKTLLEVDVIPRREWELYGPDGVKRGAKPTGSGWSPWGEWTNCSDICGGGEKTAWRNCTLHPPSPGAERPCIGDPANTVPCNTQKCGELDVMLVSSLVSMYVYIMFQYPTGNLNLRA